MEPLNDIGMIMPNGFLKIIERKKKSEHIAPEKVENIYAKCKFVADLPV